MPTACAEITKIRSEYRLDEDFLLGKRAYYKGYLKDAEVNDEFSREWLKTKYKNTFLNFLSKKIPVQKFSSERDISVYEYINSLAPHYPFIARLVDTISAEKNLDIIKSLYTNRVCRVFVWDPLNGYVPRSSKYLDLRTIPSELRSGIVPNDKDSQFAEVKINYLPLKLLLHVTKEKNIFSDFCDIEAVLACRLFSIHPSDLNASLAKFAKTFIRIFDNKKGTMTEKLSFLLGIPDDKSNFYIDKFLSSFSGISSYVMFDGSRYSLPEEFYITYNSFLKKIFSVALGAIPVVPLHDGGLFEFVKYTRIDAWIEEVNSICEEYEVKPMITAGQKHW